MSDPDILDLAAEVARLRAREAERDRAEAARLGFSPLPIPTRTQAQVAIEDAQRPADLAWKADCARRQAVQAERDAKVAPKLAKYRADVVRPLEDRLAAIRAEEVTVNEALRVAHAKAPR